MLDLIKALSQTEQVEFRKFLSSPYFNQNPRILNLYDFLRSKQKVFPWQSGSGQIDDELFRKEIFASIYAKEKFSDVKYRKLISGFMDLFRKFLAVSRFESTFADDEYKGELYLLAELKERNLRRLFEHDARALSKLLNDKISKSSEYYSACYDLDNLLFYFHYGKEPDRAEHYLNSKSVNAELGFIFMKLHLFREMIIYNETQKPGKEISPKDDFFYNEILRFIKKNKDVIKKEHPNLYFIYLTVLMYEDNGEKFSKEFLNYMNRLKKDFPKEKLKYYYTYITSYYWARVNKGDLKFRKDLFNVYKKMVEEDLLVIGKYLPDHIFNSIIMIGISEKEFNWTEKFIEKFKGDVEPSKAKDAVSLAYAKIFFYKKKYDDAINYLNNVEFKNTIYFSNAKVLLAKLYYEQGEIVPLNYLLDSLTQYTRRNKKLVPEQVLMINTFIKYMKQLIRYREKHSENVIILKKSWIMKKNMFPTGTGFMKR